MNFQAQDSLKAELSIRLISAIRDPQGWSHVLDWIIERTDARAAIITLRDKENCQIVNDVDLEQKYHSPLIRGFSHDAIMHYLTNLRTIDPWAKFQKTQYPHRPTQMSQVCPPGTIPDKTFLTWLNDQGLQDTVVFELDRMAGYWTAINLFLEKPDGPEAEQLLAFANDAYDLLRHSWQTSQAMVRQRQAASAMLALASHGGAPVCLVGANGEMIECNAMFRDLIGTDAIRLSGSDNKLSFSPWVSVHGLASWEQHDFLCHDASVEPMLLLATPVDPDPLFADKREQLWLLTCSNYGAAQIAPSIAESFNLSALTRQERELYRAVANGETVTEAGESIGLQRSRAFEVWAEVKDKLGITSAHKLRS